MLLPSFEAASIPMETLETWLTPFLSKPLMMGVGVVTFTSPTVAYLDTDVLYTLTG